jgi:drug/metabolite transporter (DMT)-like permease
MAPIDANDYDVDVDAEALAIAPTEAIVEPPRQMIAGADGRQLPQSSQPLKVLLAYLGCASIWGTTWFAIRVCIGPSGYPSYAAAALRFTISSIVLCAIWFAIRHRINDPTTTEIKWISCAGLLSGLAYGLLYSAEEQLAGGVAAVISATSPLIAAILAMFFRIENPRRTTIIGSIVAILGVALVFHDRLLVSTAQASAVGILLFNAFLNSSSNIVMKRHGHHASALAANTIFFIAASLVLWTSAILSGKCTIPLPLPLAPTLALLYLSFFGTLIAFACFFYLLKHTRLSTAMTLAFVTPLIALVVDAFFEKHSALTPESYLGIGVVLVGVAISVWFKGRDEKSQTG